MSRGRGTPFKISGVVIFIAVLCLLIYMVKSLLESLNPINSIVGTIFGEDASDEGVLAAIGSVMPWNWGIFKKND